MRTAIWNGCLQREEAARARRRGTWRLPPACLGLLVSLAPGWACAQDASSATFIPRAWEALGGKVERLEFTGSGWEACMGQPWNVNEGWARWELTDYRRVLDYASGESLQTASRRAGLDPDALGGCGAQPDAQPSPQQSSIGPASSWAQQLPLWLTPQGFLHLLEAEAPRLRQEGEGWQVDLELERDGIRYQIVADYGADFLPRRFYTEVDDSLYGNLPVEALFSEYRDFDGRSFPAALELKQGGHATLALDVDGLVPDTQAAAVPPPRQGGAGPGAGGPAAPTPEPFTEIGAGIFALNGAYQGVAVEFEDFMVVVDGLQNDARVKELIEQAKAAIPGKPIRYVISTHFHNDHANGLREFVAEGATVLIHEISADALREALQRPRSLRVEANPAAGLPVKVEGVDDHHVIADGSGQVLELHRLRGNIHADDMLVAWHPGSRTVVEADVLQPWIMPVFGGQFENGHPFLHNLADELERLELDYAQFVPVHRPTPAPLMTRADLLDAIGREP